MIYKVGEGSTSYFLHSLFIYQEAQAYSTIWSFTTMVKSNKGRKESSQRAQEEEYEERRQRKEDNSRYRKSQGLETRNEALARQQKEWHEEARLRELALKAE